MNGSSKEAFVNLIKTDLINIYKNAEEIKKNIDANHKEALDYLKSLLEQISRTASGPLIPKTPKVPRKKEIKRIETIPEDYAISDVSKASTTYVEESKMEEEEDVAPTRTSRRAASQKATANMKKQQSFAAMKKLRRPSSGDEDASPTKKPGRPRVKRTKSAATSSDDEETKRPLKYSKTKPRADDVESMRIVPKTEPDETYVASGSADKKERTSIVEGKKRGSRNKRTRGDSNGTARLERTGRSSEHRREPAVKKANIVNETMDIPENMDVTVEPSMYEDAVGKSIPMNSTMNPNTSVTIDRKIMNVTVVLEPISMPFKINETVTIKKSCSRSNSSRRSTLVNEEPADNNVPPGSPQFSKTVFQSKSSLQNKMKELKKTMANNEFDALITEDESSPERQADVTLKKETKNDKRQKHAERKKSVKSSTTSDDDDDEVVIATPAKTILRDVNGLKSLKNAYKPNALFSPYAKDSVKKRVEAFEQAGFNSPKTVDVDAPTRVTRTKTRAMAAAEAGGNQTQNLQTDAQKAARKSLAKAKKISLMKLMKENEDSKENNVISSAQKPNRLLAINDKIAQKQQQRTTPISKSRLQMPMSVNRIHHTPAGSQIINQNKAMTASRTNIVTSVESFLIPAKTLTKSTSNDNLAEKKRRANDEDARLKREEALKALTEEKRKKREEKERKNKLAREAKEKLDLEKRLKQEREREEKARAAQLSQEKQREESERKRQIQLQRAQEKEERRRQEEQLRQQRLQEQEEAERQLAEQKRREQEAERRKQIEARAQQLAAADAARLKAHYLAKARLAASKTQQGPTTYKVDSEPDTDYSDDECTPKHAIPYWAQSEVRKTQLALQQFIPLAPVLQFFGAKRCTPDLTELFKGIKKDRLQRTSSAIWKTPPRYSVMMNENRD